MDSRMTPPMTTNADIGAASRSCTKLATVGRVASHEHESAIVISESN
jgi:hypothetical protein